LEAPAGHKRDQCGGNDNEDDAGHDVAVGSHGLDFPGVNAEPAIKGTANLIRVREYSFPNLQVRIVTAGSPFIPGSFRGGFRTGPEDRLAAFFDSQKCRWIGFVAHGEQHLDRK
jgi:hypothetical protein